MCSKDGEEKPEKLERRVNPEFLGSCRQLVARGSEYRCCSLLQRTSRSKDRERTFIKPPGQAWRESDALTLSVPGTAGSTEKRQFWLCRVPRCGWDFYLPHLWVSSLLCTQCPFRSLSPAPPRQGASCKDTHKTTLERNGGNLAGSEHLSTGSWNFICSQIQHNNSTPLFFACEVTVNILIFFVGGVEPREGSIWLFLDSLEESTNSKYPLCARENSGYFRYFRSFREPNLYDQRSWYYNPYTSYKKLIWVQ